MFVGLVLILQFLQAMSDLDSLDPPPPLSGGLQWGDFEERSYRSLTLTNVVDFWGSGAK